MEKDLQVTRISAKDICVERNRFSIPLSCRISFFYGQRDGERECEYYEHGI